jgi:hypothetical protein
MNAVKQRIMTTVALAFAAAATQMARASIITIVPDPMYSSCSSIVVHGNDIVSSGYSPEIGRTVTVVNSLCDAGYCVYYPSVTVQSSDANSYVSNWGPQAVDLYVGANVITVGDSYGNYASITVRCTDGGAAMVNDEVSNGCPTPKDNCGALHPLKWYCLTASRDYKWNEDYCDDPDVKIGSWGPYPATTFGGWGPAPDTSGWTCPTLIGASTTWHWTIYSTLTDVDAGVSVWQGSITRDWTLTHAPPNNQTTVTLSGDVNGNGGCTKTP